MTESLRAPAIPAEVQVRQQRLFEEMRRMLLRGPSREAECLQDLRAWVESGAGDFSAGVSAIEASHLVEEAVEILRGLQRRAPDSDRSTSLLRRLAPLAAVAQARRSARWQWDGQRVKVRFHYAKGGELLAFDEGDLQGLFLQALRLEGLTPALDLGKRPRPWIAAGLPLPAGIASADETMDALLGREPGEASEEILHRMNQRLPEGLSLHRWRVIPEYAAPVADLAIAFHWRWPIPEAMVAEVDRALSTFQARSEVPWHRGGATLDLRQIFKAAARESGCLRFTTPAGPHLALNPLKVLGEVLGLEPTMIIGLARTGVDQRVDARLAQGDRFEPKLRNMYEDAVLLGGGSNITLVDDEDEEPLRLG